MNIGNLKSLCSLWTNLATNHRYVPYIDERDIKTFIKRVSEEGLPFITVCLPGIGKSLDRFHSTSEWISPSGFATREIILSCDGHGNVCESIVSVPRFLGKAIESALNGDSIAVDCVRQLSYIFYKLEVEYSEDLRRDFLESFRKVDSEVFSFDNIRDNIDIVSHVTSMRQIVRRILCNTDPRNIRPCHGSGATACRTQNWEKYHKLRYFPKLDNFFPYPQYFFYSSTHLVDEYERLEACPVSDPVARVVLVPKDSRGPRVISCEPAELMYIQQGLMRLLYETLESHYLTAGQINFSDQNVNKSMAKVGSMTGALATIDLSEASDRVSLSLVRNLFPAVWIEALEACRSESTLLPDGTIVDLNKFAPMGSACCFPVEALVFWASAQATLHRLKRNLKVYVYGDDLIFDGEYFPSIVEDLVSIGLVVNSDKSYYKGPFRESCGGDYHNGYDVTPVRLKKALSSSSVTALAHNADFCNSLIAKFGYESVHSIIRLIECESGYSFPRCELSIPLTIRSQKSAMNDVLFKRRYNNTLQRFEYRILSLSNHIRQRQPPSWGELLRKELTRENRQEKPLSNYFNPLAIVDSKLEPGQYADPHSARAKWVYTWIG